MTPAAQASGSLLINGAFLPGLWTRMSSADVATKIACPVDVTTFAADRWSVRYGASRGGEVSQGRSLDVPPRLGVESSLEICGNAGVIEPVLVGQSIEADDAASCRQELYFSAWCLAEHPSLRECPVRLLIRQPKTRDVFDATAEILARTAVQSVPVGMWTRLEFGIDARAAKATGLGVEIELPASFLCHPQARIRLTAAALWPASQAEPGWRPAALETQLARRFCQRHDGRVVNAIGRALVCNAHELHFQFTFPEMRAFPAITLPQDNAALTVFSPDGIPQTGFVYDVPYRARGSAMIRAAKWHHALSDGFLAFRGYDESILLEAEL